MHCTTSEQLSPRPRRRFIHRNKSAEDSYRGECDLPAGDKLRRPAAPPPTQSLEAIKNAEDCPQSDVAFGDCSLERSLREPSHCA